MSHEFWLDTIAITAFFINSWFMVGTAKLNKVHEWHHGYLGLGLVILALVLSSVVVMGIGTVLLLDDAWQHHRQQTVSEYLSPLHRLYLVLYTRWPWLRKVGEWLDKFCR